MNPSTSSPSHGKQRLARLGHKARHLLTLYLLVAPSTIIIAVLGYYPKFDVVHKSMYRWEPPDVVEFIGFKNFVDAFSDPLFWQSFQLVFILLTANIFKLWPGIFAAVALNRINNERLRYIFQVCFVVPMVIPAMVWLLIWKSFYDPDFGVLNRFLNASGLMRFLHFLDGTENAPGLMPRTADALEPLRENVLSHLFVSTWGVLLIGAFLIMLAHHGNDKPRRLRSAGLILAAASLPLLLQTFQAPGSWVIALALFIILMFLLARTLGPGWVIWMFLLSAGLYAFHGSYLHLILLPALAIGLAEFLRNLKERFAAEALMKIAGSIVFSLGFLIILLGEVWTEPIGQFEMGQPAWLGSSELVIPALLFWGFPWVNTMGVLIYLAGLQQIPQDVYEAAEIDGIGPIGMLFRIELPLILTQVRINLIFMTITTLVSYEMFLILLGPRGGPGNRGMVPGLYMFSEAFLENRFGYACALGMFLFFIILGLTIIYNKYVKVEK